MINIGKLLLLMTVVFYVYTPTLYGQSDAKYGTYFYAVLDAHKNLKHGVEPKTIDRLYDLNDKSKNANSELVQLLDYYIGEGPSEILDELISAKGKVMLPLLLEKRKGPLNCLSKYKSLCLDKDTRDENLDMLIEAINKGKVLKADE